MNQPNYNDIINLLTRANQYEELSNIIFVSGGIVPWLVSKKNSNRNHGDIDFIVAQENMPKVRAFLEKHNLYDAALDSLTYEDAKEVDYGVDTFIDGIPIGFYPYEQMPDNLMVQRSFSPTEIDGKKDLKVMEIPNMDIADYFATTTLPDGSTMGISSLEVVKATKEKAGREKDYYDIQEIDRIGYDSDRYNRVKNAINNMKSTLDDRKLGKQI